MATRAKTKPSTKRSRRSRPVSARRRPRGGHANASASARRRKPVSIGALTVQQMVPVDAILLLEQDHQEVEAFFERFEQADEDAEKQELARKICLALTVHAEIEERIFYPAAREATEDDEVLDEALVEHQAAKALIAEIVDMDVGDSHFDAKVTVLGEYVRHHVAEERSALFAEVRDSGALDLYELGARLAAAKVDLLAAAAKEM